DIPAPPSARLVSYLFPDMFQLIVTERSGIRQVADLRGKRVGVPPKGGGQYKSFLFLAEHYGLNSQDPLYTAMPDDLLNEAFRTNRVDAVFRVRAPGNDQVRELVEKYRGRLVGIEQGSAMKLKQSALDPASIPKGAYQGTPPIPATDLPTVAVQRLLLANQTLEPEVVQKITAILYERRQDLVKTMPLASYITQPTIGSGTGLPIHPGAQTFYDRDKPPFYQENADFLGLILSLSLLTWSSLSWLKSRFLQGQKDEADEYIERVVYLMNAEKNPETRRELRMVLSDAVQALVDEKISLDSFQSFRVVWQIAMDEIRDQESNPNVSAPVAGGLHSPIQKQGPNRT
ncbi:MAG: TAXI family TRAP transporter solute-binding subunit, partial [Leptolyngbyaceae cyanobacterium bins.59]|nr:TAXI family TRAP transporter solute-binding subunit [Leptolyngbyaceae cyanobacterium bins.59]